MNIRQTTSETDIAASRALFEEYAAGLGVELCFQGFAAELAGLPGPYAPPRGRLLLAWVDGGAVGCVALRPLGDSVCEIKRLFVKPAFRGQGVGRRLAEAVISEARTVGYAGMRLDTLPSMSAATRLYTALSFVRIPAYYGTPLRDTIFMELRL